MITRRISPILFLALLFSLLVSVVSAADATSFCKCTCGSNSTIIPLRYEPPDPQPDLSQYNDTDTDTDKDPPPRKTGTCSDCNRSFCLEMKVNELPICDETKDEQIFTDCFQRDSAKDEAIIYGFIVLTVGLLVYATIRPWVHRRVEAYQEQRQYSAVPTGQGPG